MYQMCWLLQTSSSSDACLYYFSTAASSSQFKKNICKACCSDHNTSAVQIFQAKLLKQDISIELLGCFHGGAAYFAH